MILRLSQKLNARIKGDTLGVLPPHENLLLDWSAQAFAVGRAEYILLSNTSSLYSAVLDGTGFTDTNGFTEHVLRGIRALLEGTGDDAAHRLLPASACKSVQFAKALDRSVIGSMNELVAHATAFLGDGGLSVPDVGVRLNDVLLSSLAPTATNKYGRPRDTFMLLLANANA